MACFACDSCKRQLSTGEEFGLHDNRVMCKTHYLELLEGGFTDSDGELSVGWWGNISAVTDLILTKP